MIMQFVRYMNCPLEVHMFAVIPWSGTENQNFGPPLLFPIVFVLSFIVVPIIAVFTIPPDQRPQDGVDSTAANREMH